MTNPSHSQYDGGFDTMHHSSAEEPAAKSLVRTVDHLKSTTTNMRGLADSLDHLLNALEEFYPFIDNFLSGTKHLQNRMRRPSPPMYRCDRRYK